MANVFIDNSMIVQLATSLFITISGTGYVVVPLGSADPTDAAVIIRMLACDVKPMRRVNATENDLGNVKIVVSVEVSAAREEADQATMDGACAAVRQAISMTYVADATSDHQLHLDDAEVQEAPTPDEQRKIRAAIVTVNGWCRRGSGLTIAHP